MYDKKLVLNSLLNIQKALALISERMENIHQVDDFLRSPDGMVLLDAILSNISKDSAIFFKTFQSFLAQTGLYHEIIV